jgi:hypothetical protein
MWGPPDAVQFAVRQNAERMGIDPSSVKLLDPYWLKAGQPFDIISNKTPATWSGSWVPQGVTFNGAQHLEYANTGGLFTGLTGLTLLTITRINSVDVDDEGIIGAWDSASSKYVQISTRNAIREDSVRMFVYDGTSLGVTDIANKGLTSWVADSKFKSFCGTWDVSGTVNLYVDATLFGNASSGPTSALPTGFDNFRIATYYNNGIRQLNADFGIATVFSVALTPTQIAQLHEAPYALLMPVARPFIFDMAGGGGLAAPTLTSPAQFSTQSQPVTLQWSAVAGATKYQVQVAQDSLFTTPSVDQIVTGGTTLGIDGLADNTEHFWRVRAGDDN